MISEATDNTEPQVPVSRAARAIGRRRGFVIDLIESGRVPAYRIGGGKKQTRLAVRLSELRQAVEVVTRYVPEGLAQVPEVARVRRPGKLHPAAQRMLARGA